MANFYRYYQNRESKEIHRVVVTDGREFSQEQCNLDDARANLEAITEDEALARLEGGQGDRCGHCWTIGAGAGQEA